VKRTYADLCFVQVRLSSRLKGCLGRYRQRQPGVPSSGGTIGGVVRFEIHVALHAGDHEKVSDLRGDADQARLERLSFAPDP
jgi:hypothetical protein